MINFAQDGSTGTDDVYFRVFPLPSYRLLRPLALRLVRSDDEVTVICDSVALAGTGSDLTAAVRDFNAHVIDILNDGASGLESFSSERRTQRERLALFVEPRDFSDELYEHQAHNA